MGRERPDHTLQPTALVHEAYLRLVEQRRTNWRSRAQFYAVAARLMRRILVDHAKGRLRAKRGGGEPRVSLSLDDVLVLTSDKSAELVALDESLTRLANLDPRQGQVVELRFFGGLTVEETAEVLKVSPKTVRRDWSFAKAWLYGELKERHGIERGAVGENQGAV